jgi:cobalt/nickel transport system permease protein
MADALLSPVIGGVFCGISIVLIGYSAGKIRKEKDDQSVPLMGVMGAFVFAAQMINFSIPFTGSSGHIGGGLLLAIFLGPYRAFLTLASVLVVQAFLFADGGILALGCNIFNLGFFPSFIAYPFVWNLIIKKNSHGGVIPFTAVAAAIAGLLPGALFVVIETVLSGNTDLTFFTFSSLMIPVHLVIAAVEGLITAGVVLFVKKNKPVLIEGQEKSIEVDTVIFAVLAIILGGFLSWFASSKPDGLEWAIGKMTGQNEPLFLQGHVHSFFSSVQQTLSFFPDYKFGISGNSSGFISTAGGGIIGVVVVCLIALIVGFLAKQKKSNKVK